MRTDDLISACSLWQT